MFFEMSIFHKEIYLTENIHNTKKWIFLEFFPSLLLLFFRQKSYEMHLGNVFSRYDSCLFPRYSSQIKSLILFFYEKHLRRGFEDSTPIIQVSSFRIVVYENLFYS